MIGNNINIAIIPDIHGRSFWKKSVNYLLKETNIPIVFLGDYLDPYYNDFFDEETDEPLNEGYNNMSEVLGITVNMFQEIIELKKKYPDRIILLLGNHDCGYLYGIDYCYSSRRDKINARILEKLFNDNKDLFQLAYETTINEKHFIFSHAGINQKYAHDCFGDEVNEDNVVSLFNKAYKEDNYGVIQSLTYYSRFRGKWGGKYGSLIWADSQEWFVNDNKAYGISVVGHTKFKEPYINDKFIFLDTKECYVITNNGNLEKIQK